ncbi:MAG: SH3 domain-containing protein [Candidatus Aureabacteria bacterium]|nr:SH3 domain-containing protein [Candidatus Auribacterota bacterium]
MEKNIFRIIIFLAVFFLISSRTCCFALFCEITGDNVNVRAGAGTNYDVICQLNRSDIVRVSKVAGEWIEIYPNEKIFGWVKASHIENNKVTAEKLNVRAGASRNYSLICQLKQGDDVSILGELGSWKKIILPDYARVYIYKKYAKSIPSASIAKAATDIKKTIDEKTETRSSVKSENGEEPVSAVTATGWLEDLGVLINRPGTYKLLQQDNRKTILYFIKEGKQPLTFFSKNLVEIKGRLFYISSWSKPVIEVEEIKRVK